MMDQTQRAADGRASSVRPPYNHCHQHSTFSSFANLEFGHKVHIQRSGQKCSISKQYICQTSIQSFSSTFSSVANLRFGKFQVCQFQSNISIWPPQNHCHQQSHLSHSLPILPAFLPSACHNLALGPKITNVLYLMSFDVNLTLVETNLTPTMGCSQNFLGWPYIFLGWFHTIWGWPHTLKEVSLIYSRSLASCNLRLAFSALQILFGLTDELLLWDVKHMC